MELCATYHDSGCLTSAVDCYNKLQPLMACVAGSMPANANCCSPFFDFQAGSICECPTVSGTNPNCSTYSASPGEDTYQVTMPLLAPAPRSDFADFTLFKANNYCTNSLFGYESCSAYYSTCLESETSCYNSLKPLFACSEASGAACCAGFFDFRQGSVCQCPKLSGTNIDCALGGPSIGRDTYKLKAVPGLVSTATVSAGRPRSHPGACVVAVAATALAAVATLVAARPR